MKNTSRTADSHPPQRRHAVHNSKRPAPTSTIATANVPAKLHFTGTSSCVSLSCQPEISESFQSPAVNHSKAITNADTKPIQWLPSTPKTERAARVIAPIVSLIRAAAVRRPRSSV